MAICNLLKSVGEQCRNNVVTYKIMCTCLWFISLCKCWQKFVLDVKILWGLWAKVHVDIGKVLCTLWNAKLHWTSLILPLVRMPPIIIKMMWNLRLLNIIVCVPHVVVNPQVKLACSSVVVSIPQVVVNRQEH
jgi:hypothetical protein